MEMHKTHKIVMRLLERENRMRQRGFTILEMSVALITFGLLISTVVMLLNASTNTTSVTGQASTDGTLAEADRSVVGYALGHFVFPQPVANAPIDIGSLVAGQLAANAAGVATTPKTWYWVDARLLDPSSYQPDPDNLTQGRLPARPTPSLVDLCNALKTVQQSPNAWVGNVPVAAVLATAGSGGSVAFPSALPLPGSSAALQLSTQGLSVSALGASELIGRLRCPYTLGAATSSMRAVAIATDLQAWAGDMVNFRGLELASDQQTDFSTKLRLDLTIATLSTLSADLLSSTVQAGIAAVTAKSLVSAAEAANSLVGISVLVGYIGITAAQLASIQTTLENAPSNVTADQVALDWANRLQNSAGAALNNAQSAYSWSLMGL